MKNKSDDYIDIFCGDCQTENHISFEQSLSENHTNCTQCGTIIYWHNCPECGTGFYNLEKECNCPDCTEKKQGSVQEERFRIPIYEKECPWCNTPTNMIPYLISKRFIVDCRSCGKPFKIKRLFVAVAVFILYSIIMAAISKPLLLWLRINTIIPDDIYKLLFAIILISSGLFILIRSFSLVKYKQGK